MSALELNQANLTYLIASKSSYRISVQTQLDARCKVRSGDLMLCVLAKAMQGSLIADRCSSHLNAGDTGHDAAKIRHYEPITTQLVRVPVR